MSSFMRENSRPRVDYPNFSGIVRRMVSLPRNILGGCTRAVEHGIDLMGRDRMSQMFLPPPPPPLPPHLPVFPPHYTTETATVADEWEFFNSFEQSYGATHPFFYACRFIQALKIAQDEKKFLFLYLHSIDHPFAAEFCRETLGSEVVVQFLDANFVSWGAIHDRGEGLQMSGVLRAASFPFCAVVAPASGDDISVLQQIEGPASPAELLEILQMTLEEQGVAFGGVRAKEEEKRRADRWLREEQDAAYLAALKLDQDRERLQNSAKEEQTVQKSVERAPSSSSDKECNLRPRQNASLTKSSQVKEDTANRENQHKDSLNKAKHNQLTQILVRFPNGERMEQRFSVTDNVQAVYKYIDSLGLPGIGSYRLISSFPRKVFAADQMGMTLKDAGLYPRASLFLELL